LSKTFAAVVLAEAFILVFQYLTGHLYFGKPLGTIGESNAVFGLVLDLISLGCFSFVYLVPICLLIIFSGSRSALLSLVVLSGVFLTKLKSNFKKPVALTVILLVFAGILYISNGKSTSFIEDRPAIWKIAVSKIYQKPILGYGAESGEFVFNKAFLSRDISLENIIIDRTHNLFLDILMWSGILGLTAFAGWLCFGFVSLDGTGKKFAFLALLTYSMFQPLSIVHWILLLIIINI
jgi:O-antigen ligase